MYLHFQQLLLVRSKINCIYNLPLEISIYKNPSLLVLSSEVPKYLDIGNPKRLLRILPPPPNPSTVRHEIIILVKVANLLVNSCGNLRRYYNYVAENCWQETSTCCLRPRRSSSGYLRMIILLSETYLIST